MVAIIIMGFGPFEGICTSKTGSMDVRNGLELADKRCFSETRTDRVEVSNQSDFRVT